MNMVEAQESRMVLDKLAGYTLSPVLWRYVSPGLSAGRVQSCGLHLISDRERARWAFVTSNFYTINALFQLPHQDQVFEAKLFQWNQQDIAEERDFDGATGKIKSKNTIVLDEASAKDVMEWLSGLKTSVKYTITNKTERKTSRNPPVPYITSTLQQDASQKLGFSPSRTMSIAQTLYESGYITYMRTDSPTLSASALTIAKSLATSLFGEDSVGDGSSTKSKKSPKNAQEAHEAIRPATLNEGFAMPDSLPLDVDQRKLYDLIYRRTLASVMKPSLSSTTTVTITAAEESGSKDSAEGIFRASETETVFDGYLAAMRRKPEKKVMIFTNVQIGQVLKLSSKSSSEVTTIPATPDIDIDVDETTAAVSADDEKTNVNPALQFPGLKSAEHSTRPPSRFTEASFVKELETKGVGRPSTYAKIFQVLKERGYILVDRQTIVPTVRGLMVSKFLESEFGDFINENFTAEMEGSLDKIANGEGDKQQFLKSFYFGTEQVDGLLTKTSKLVEDNGKVHHKDSRSLVLPYLERWGRIILNRYGIAFEGNPDTIHELNPSKVVSKSGDDGSAPPNLLWKLPILMEQDIRSISLEAVKTIVENEVTIDGKAMGIIPETQETVLFRVGRYGKYLEIVSADGTERRSNSVPMWFDDSVPFHHILDIINLPKSLGMHSSLNVNMSVSILAGKLTLLGEGYLYKAEVPDGIFVSDITTTLAEDLLSSATVRVGNVRELGPWENELVSIRDGRFGLYLKGGAVICGLGKKDPETITLEEAIIMLRAKKNRAPKVVGKKKAAPAKKKKATTTKAKKSDSDTESTATTKPKATKKKTTTATKKTKITASDADTTTTEEAPKKRGRKPKAESETVAETVVEAAPEVAKKATATKKVTATKKSTTKKAATTKKTATKASTKKTTTKRTTAKETATSE